MNRSLEFCVTELKGAEIAQEYGANRIELCVDLSVGGLTPSAGLIEACANIIETHVLIRPRSGNFIYTQDELAIIRADILQAHLAGATGIVFGCLDEKNGLDQAANESILALAEQLDMPTTFHRAFDFVADPLVALDTLMDWEVKKILTSGQEKSAILGKDLLKELAQKANDRIEIMAGGGVNPTNAQALLDSGVHALHCSIHQQSKAEGDMGQQLEYDLAKIMGMIDFKS